MVSGEMYQPVLSQFAARHHVIVPDLRGHGRSADLPGPYNVPQLAKDLAEVLDRLKIDSADVLGYSQGGAVAQQLALDYPERVRRLVLACTYSCNLLSRRERLEGAVMPWVVRLIGPAGLARLIVFAGGGGPPLMREQRDGLRNMLAANDRAHAVAAIQAMTSFDSRGWLDRITRPTLVIAGDADTAVPLHHARMLAAGIPGARLRLVEGAGHTLLWTHSEELVRLTEAFLTEALEAE
jgi:3-oxoadipate enol-lactonase